jgi:hypothetical protein
MTYKILKPTCVYSLNFPDFNWNFMRQTKKQKVSRRFHIRIKTFIDTPCSRRTFLAPSWSGVSRIVPNVSKSFLDNARTDIGKLFAEDETLPMHQRLPFMCYPDRGLYYIFGIDSRAPVQQYVSYNT